MFDHVTIRVTDREASERFYVTVLLPLRIEKSYRTRQFTEWQGFSVSPAAAAQPPTRRHHPRVLGPSQEQAQAFWQAGTDAGHPDEGAPGPRPEYRDDYYGAFLLDPDGNSIEAVHHGGLRRGGIIDHLWMRVADLDAARRFYETIAPYAGLRVEAGTADRVMVFGSSGRFALVRGTP